jgi:hypothetical protein
LNVTTPLADAMGVGESQLTMMTRYVLGPVPGLTRTAVSLADCVLSLVLLATMLPCSSTMYKSMSLPSGASAHLIEAANVPRRVCQ